MSAMDTLAPENAVLLSGEEQRKLAIRLTLALSAGACLILSVLLETINPAQQDVAQLVAGIAAVLVGGPAISAAWSNPFSARACASPWYRPSVPSRRWWPTNSAVRPTISWSFRRWRLTSAASTSRGPIQMPMRTPTRGLPRFPRI